MDEDGVQIQSTELKHMFIEDMNTFDRMFGGFSNYKIGVLSTCVTKHQTIEYTWNNNTATDISATVYL